MEINTGQFYFLINKYMSEEKKMKKILKVEKVASSGLSAFVERPLPSEKEVSNFEKVIEREARHQEIDSNLSEIYRSKDGSMINVKKMKIKKMILGNEAAALASVRPSAVLKNGSPAKEVL